MRLRTMFLVSASALVLASCASSRGPQDLPLYGNYENVDDRSLCLGMMAYAADFPQAVWPGQSKGFYGGKKEDLGTKSAALYKTTLKKYGKQDAAERGITGYSSARSLAYVLGGGAVQDALGRCEGTVAEALEVDADYQNFLNHLGKAPEKPAVPEIVSGAPSVTERKASAPQPIIEVPATSVPVIEVTPEVVQKKQVRRYTPDQVPAGMKILSTPGGDYFVKDTQSFNVDGEPSSADLNRRALAGGKFTPVDLNTSGDTLNAKWRKENLSN